MLCGFLPQQTSCVCVHNTSVYLCSVAWAFSQDSLQLLFVSAGEQRVPVCAQTSRLAQLRAMAESSGCTSFLSRLHAPSAAACSPGWTNIHLWLTSHYRTLHVIVWNSEPLGCTDSRCSLIKRTIKQLWGFMTAPPDRIHSQCCL